MRASDNHRNPRPLFVTDFDDGSNGQVIRRGAGYSDQLWLVLGAWDRIERHVYNPHVMATVL
jgi:hypothetical protein